MKHRPRAAAAAAVIALLVPIGAACSSDDGTGSAVVRNVASEQPEPATSPGEVADDVETPGSTGSTETTGSTEPAGSEPGTAGGGEPQDQAIDVNLRTPEGVTLTLSRLSFDSGDILVEAEVVNGSTYDITFHSGAGYDTALRLVDDSDQVYPFIETTEGEDCSPYICDDGLDLAPGERISGILAFRGPLYGEPSRLTLITNVKPNDAAGFDIADQTDPYYPAFVVPMDVTWA